MHKLLGYLAVLGTVIFIESAHAGTDASSCPPGVLIADLKKMCDTPVDSKLEWKNEEWTVTSNSCNDSKKLIPPIGTRLYVAQVFNDILECNYSIYIRGTSKFTIILSTPFTGMEK